MLDPKYDNIILTWNNMDIEVSDGYIYYIQMTNTEF